MSRTNWYPEKVFGKLYPKQPQGMSRRTFFRISSVAGGGLVLAMNLPGCGKPASKDNEQPASQDNATKTPELSSKEPFAPNVWVKIEPDNTATITISKSEMGQGVRTTLALIVAEELDLDWSKVRVAQAPLDSKKYGSQGTGGSASVRTLWKQLREAGAAARVMLVGAAAQALGVDAGSLTTENGHVVHAATQRKLAYGALGDTAAKQTAPAQVTLKDPKNYRLLGKEHVGIDVGDIITGKAVYGMDVKQDGLLYASVERSPVHGGKVKAFRPDKAKAVPGVKNVVEIPAVTEKGTHVRSGVAVIADNTWAAMQGRKALEIDWDPGPNGKETSAAHSAELKKLTSAKGKDLINRIGDPDAVLAKAKNNVLRATYEVPFIAHATMEPMNCTAHVQGDRCTLWGPIQVPEWAAGAVADALGIPPANVEVHVTLLGGGFGRRLNPDFAAEAALVAKHADKPVKVMWTREDDMRNDFYRPPAMHVIEASLGADGYPEAWRHRMSTPAISVSLDPTTKDPGVEESNGASDMLYRIPNRSCEYSLLSSGITRGWWRAVHTTHTSFAVESFIDELAEKAGKDPYEFRMHLIDVLTVDRPEQDKDFPFQPERLKGVLKLAAEKAGWGKQLPAGHGMGIACAIDHLSYAAEVIEVSVTDGKLKVHKVVCAADCGPVFNPNSARAQMEGGVIQGLSAALREKITIRNGSVEQGNFDTYPILRINDCPVVIESYFAETDAHPTGLGEPSLPPVAPALASAIYKATGKRPRTLPITL